MPNRSVSPEIDRLIGLLSKLPGLGPRSARRAALALLKKPDALMSPLAQAMGEAAERPCHICVSTTRDITTLCVVQDVSDLWAMERAGAFRGYYHVLGGTLSALDGVRPEDLNIASLIQRAGEGDVAEVILAMNATVDGQTTAHYITDQIEFARCPQVQRQRSCNLTFPPGKISGVVLQYPVLISPSRSTC